MSRFRKNVLTSSLEIGHRQSTVKHAELKTARGSAVAENTLHSLEIHRHMAPQFTVVKLPDLEKIAATTTLPVESFYTLHDD